MMKEIYLDEIRTIEVTILNYIHGICKQYGLRYFLIGGALIGSKKYKGFIPWDDDIDICLPRNDYETLINIIEKENIYCPLNYKYNGYYYNFTKVVDKNTKLVELDYKELDFMGVCVDVFPIDGLPDNYGYFFNKLDKIRKNINMYAFKPKGKAKNIYQYLHRKYVYLRCKTTSLESLQKKYIRFAKRNNFDNSNYVIITGASHGKLDVFLKQIFDEHILVEFEGNYYRTLADFEIYLHQIYGNYMDELPKDQQITHHKFKAYSQNSRKS